MRGKLKSVGKYGKQSWVHSDKAKGRVRKIR